MSNKYEMRMNDAKPSSSLLLVLDSNQGNLCWFRLLCRPIYGYDANVAHHLGTFPSAINLSVKCGLKEPPSPAVMDLSAASAVGMSPFHHQMQFGGRVPASPAMPSPQDLSLTRSGVTHK